MLTQIGVVIGLGFIAKQRSGFGFDYMSVGGGGVISAQKVLF